jgi:hypothetical protein
MDSPWSQKAGAVNLECSYQQLGFRNERKTNSKLRPSCDNLFHIDRNC